MLDGARTNGYIGWASAGEVVTLTVSVYGMKVTDQFARITVRQHLYTLASFSSCEDDGIWYFMVATGEPPTDDGSPSSYNIHVFEVANLGDVHDIAALMTATLDEAFKKAHPVPGTVDLTVPSAPPLLSSFKVKKHATAVEAPAPPPAPSSGGGGGAGAWAEIKGSSEVHRRNSLKAEQTTGVAGASATASANNHDSGSNNDDATSSIAATTGSFSINGGDSTSAIMQTQNPSASAHDDGGLWGSKRESKETALIRLGSAPIESPLSPNVTSPIPEIPVAWPPRPITDHGKAVQEYMAELQQVLSKQEQIEFAILLRAYRNGMALEQFVSKLLVLFGEERMYMLPGMRPFVPQDSTSKFDAFITKHVPQKKMYRPSDIAAAKQAQKKLNPGALINMASPPMQSKPNAHFFPGSPPISPPAVTDGQVQSSFKAQLARAQSNAASTSAPTPPAPPAQEHSPSPRAAAAAASST